MVSYFIKRFVKDKDNIKDINVRESYGRVTSIVGIFINIILFAGKFLAGILSNSVSITADAINNLSDAGSSIIALISFKISNKPADEDHPFGHARYETIASLIVAAFILVLGFDLIKTSFQKILEPDEITFSYISIVVLIFSISMKFYMYRYNKKYGKMLNSSILDATAADSISDVMATGAVLFSAILSPLIHFQLDGYMGVVVACFIIHAGAQIIKDALDVLLGKAPDKEFVNELIDKINSYEGVLGIHDLIVHDYGPQRTFASVHVEVDGNKNIFSSHDIVDNIERDIYHEMHISLVIHMDPIKKDDEITNTLKAYTAHAVKQVHEELSIHDFRVVPGDTHTNLIFDITVPYSIKMKNDELLLQIEEIIHKDHSDYFLVVTFDRLYAS